MKKVGWFLLCFVPLIGMLTIQVIVTLVIEFFEIFKYFFTAGSNAMAGYYAFVTSLVSSKNFLMTVTITFQIMALIVAAIVYYFVFKEKKIENPIKCTGVKGIPFIAILFFGCEVFTGCILWGAFFVVPSVMNDYAEMIKKSGLSDLSFLSTLATIVLAPLAEELIFRGMTFKIARKFTCKFWLANIIQAAIFGLAHMNIVQGTYAFLLGLLLGLVYKKYNSLYATMLGHLVFNFTGTYLAGPLFGADETLTPAWRICVLAVVSAACIVLGILLISKDSKSAERVALFNERYAMERLPKQKTAVQPVEIQTETVEAAGAETKETEDYSKPVIENSDEN